jgi:hypothetical protein
MGRLKVSVGTVGVLLFVLAGPPAGRAQTGAALEPDAEAVAATIAAVQYLFAVDSLETVSWPSARSLLARRPGTVTMSGTSVKFGEDPAGAIALTERVAVTLRSQGIASRAVPRSDTRHCGIGNTNSCTLPDDIGLSMLIGYSSASDSSHVAHITMVTDSRVRSGRPVVSLDMLLRRIDGAWTVVSVRRTTLLF